MQHRRNLPFSLFLWIFADYVRVNAQNQPRDSLILTDITLLINYAGKRVEKSGRTRRTVGVGKERERKSKQSRESVTG